MSAEAEASKAAEALTRQMSGLQKAATDAGAAASHAKGSVAQAQRAGFARVADNIGNVQSQIEKLAATLSSAADQLTPGQTAAADAANEQEPDRAVAKLQTVVAAIDTAQAAVAATVQEAGMLQGVKNQAATAGREGQTGKKHAEAGIAHGEQIGAGDSGN